MTRLRKPIPQTHETKNAADASRRPRLQNRIRPYFFFSSFLASFLASAIAVLQPPLPLQEFLPLQPLSLEPQPPWPLHAFLPLQSCLAVSVLPFSSVPAFFS